MPEDEQPKGTPPDDSPGRSETLEAELAALEAMLPPEPASSEPASHDCDTNENRP